MTESKRNQEVQPWLLLVAVLGCVGAGFAATSSGAVSRGVVFSDGYGSFPIYSPCGASGNITKVGFSGDLVEAATASIAIAGTLVIFDDCYFAVNFTTSPKAPLLTFWSNADPTGNFSWAGPINPDFEFNISAAARTVVVYIKAGGLIWDNIGVIYVYCAACKGGGGEVLASIRIGVISNGGGIVREYQAIVEGAAKNQQLIKPPPPPSPSPPPPQTNYSANGPGANFENCVQGIPNRLNM